MKVHWLSFVLVVGAAACGGHSDSPGDAGPPPGGDASVPVSDASMSSDDGSTPDGDASTPAADGSTPLDGGATPLPYLQVDLNITGGQVSAGSTGLTQGQVAFSAVTPLSIAPPPAALGGEYGLVAMMNGQPQAFAFVHFPASFLVEGPDANGDWVAQSVSVTASAVTVFVPYAAYDALEVIDTAGNVVATQSGVPVFPSAALQYDTTSNGYSPLPGLTVLTPTAAKNYLTQWPADYPVTFTYDITTDPNGQLAIKAALASLAPGPLAAVHYILIADNSSTFSSFGGVEVDDGSALIINVGKLTDPSLAAVLVHESAHVYADLLELAGGPASQPTWPPGISALAAKAAADPLQAGFITFWTQMHNDGVQAQLAIAYDSDPYVTVPDVSARAGGFVTPYGGKSAHEDIATYTEFMQVPDGTRANYQPSKYSVYEPTAAGPAWFCADFPSAQSFPVKDTIPFVKAELLVNAGFITLDKLEGCIGDHVPVIGATGVFVENGDGTDATSIPKVPGQNGLAAGVDATGHAWIAAGGLYSTQANVNLVPDAHENPLGWFRFSKRGASGQLAGPMFSFFGQVGDALVFVQEASSSQVSFAMFNVEVKEVTASGLTTAVFPYSTFSVPIPQGAGCPISGWSCSLTDPTGAMVECVDNYLMPGDGDYDPNSTTFGPELCNPGIASNYLDPSSNYYGYHTDLEKTPCPSSPCGGCSLPEAACLPNNDNRSVDIIRWYYKDCQSYQSSCLQLDAINAYPGAPDESYLWITP